jgi:hypothetical protein
MNEQLKPVLLAGAGPTGMMAAIELALSAKCHGPIALSTSLPLNQRAQQKSRFRSDRVRTFQVDSSNLDRLVVRQRQLNNLGHRSRRHRLSIDSERKRTSKFRGRRPKQARADSNFCASCNDPITWPQFSS